MAADSCCWSRWWRYWRRRWSWEKGSGGNKEWEEVEAVA
jgi:hypothetical protein